MNFANNEGLFCPPKYFWNKKWLDQTTLSKKGNAENTGTIRKKAPTEAVFQRDVKVLSINEIGD